MNIKEKIWDVLKADDRLWNKDKSESNQILLLDLVEKIDEKIIELLLQEDNLREKFFVKIKDAYVFKTNDFRFFMEENKVDNSYTAYKNRIGLTDGKRFLKDSKDVVLDFPYKDCVLEGGQSTEEGIDTYFEYDEKGEEYKEKTAKRKEIFFNTVLAYDEVDRLFDPKALTNWKRYTKDGEEEVKEIKRGEDGTIKENLIIKGNNLLALHSLKKQFAGKVKLIYIDPPYNTGNDGFKYNDNFNHSTWLTFMKNRLEVARELLREDGAIAIHCDDNEQAYLKVLVDDIFGRKNFIANSVRIAKTGGGHDSQYLAVEYDYVLLIAKNKDKLILNQMTVDTEADKKYKLTDEYLEKRGKYYLRDLDYVGSYSESLDYPIQIDINKSIYPGGKKGKPNTWRWSKKKFEWGIQNGFIVVNKQKEKVYIKQYQFVDNEDNLRDREVPFRALINSINSEGAKEISGLFENKVFNFPKPENFIKYLLDFSTKEKDIVLDYHLGSGTTCAVAQKMGRQYIGIEQMDYIETVAVERLKKVIDGEKGGISQNVDWQGGGDFIYFELTKWNETAKEKILTLESLEELEEFFDTLYEKYFLNYSLKVKDFREKVIQEDEFKALSLEEQKRMFLTMLDLNQMYVNKTEMEDKRFAISEEDQKLTTEFYN
jgi:adenine-specific DNA-methyltransferase